MKTQAIIDAAQSALDDIRNPEYPNSRATRDVVRARVALSALIAALKSELKSEDGSPQRDHSGSIREEVGRLEAEVRHDEGTLRKVYMGLWQEGIYGQKAVDVVTALQNVGILFRERA